MLKRVLPLLVLILLSGCSTLPVTRKAVQGAAIETLQGSVNFSLSSSAGQLSGNGVLFYQRPDSFRLTILAPFGQVMLDIIVEGKQVLCLRESHKIAWRGRLGDLPDALGTKIWPLMQWVVEPQQPPGPALTRVFTRPDGTAEKVYYDEAGLVQRKVNSVGDEVLYSHYRVTDAVGLAGTMEIKTIEGSRLKLTFDEPELNHPIDGEIFNPKLERYEILPLAEFKGF